MSPLAIVYQDKIIRSVVADRPAMCYPVHQPLALEDICNLLADGAEAKRLLRAKGWGQPGMTVLEIAQLLPCAPQRPARKKKGKR
ncbi:hypothetical protein QPK31_24935 [Massilia sp. YIM B02769]|uniref:hypothetical protein n=1 Tax=Massilia sp. YIM B02769 TaxID=3050129 RepID=UPI0025B70C16|nr:hypothetical protein [Massilia sp. YIM B02769]MDN4061472.1 hypothetical protein [Massilia sp. YIM B02769]